MPKKILLVIPNFGFGGAQRVFADHARLFSQFAEVEECVFNLSYAQEYETDYIVHNLNVREGKFFLDKAIRFYERIWALRRLKKNNQYDICISHLEGADYVNILSRYSEKTILVVHGSKTADENMKGIVGWIRKSILLPFLYKRADLIVAVSDGIKKELEENYSLPSSRILSIPNYFNIANIVSASEKDSDPYITTLKRTNKVVLYSGRFAEQKNLLPLFHIFKTLKKEEIEVKLVLVGDGELKNSLLEECERLELKVFQKGDLFNDTYDVYFLGYYSNPFPFIKASDVFVMTSKWEGFPMALCEAMALGCCVIASDCPTGPDQILHYKDNNGNDQYAGTILPIPLINNDQLIIQWANSIVSLLMSEELRNQYVLKGKERVRSFSEETIAIKWKNVLGAVNQLAK